MYAPIQTGSFVSTGAAQIINLRSDVSAMDVYNMTEIATATGSHGVQYYWQRGMASNNGIVYLRNAAATAIDIDTSASLTVPGFVLIDSSVQSPGASTALTSISNANPPRVLVASTAGLTDGMVVRIFNTVGAQQLGGIDFTIDVIDGTHFDLLYMEQIVAAAGPGTYRVIPFDPIFYPRRRFISSISQAAQAVVRMTVTHQYTVGQKVRFVVPPSYGMTQINGLQADIVAINTVTNAITVNIDTTAFTAFAFPVTSPIPFSPAEIVPIGESADATIADPNLLDDATLNTAFLGLQLGAGITSPAGSVGDVIMWKAYAAFNL
jgi:hypothetical protein